ncbi:MAG: hypothetical protein R6U96_03335 [Promethearchaeia archaeon]
MNPIEKPAVEEVIFYLDLLEDHIKRKNLLSMLRNFMHEKHKYYSSNASYGCVLFLENDNPITIYDTTEIKELLDTIKKAWKEREQEQSRFENGLFEILSYIFRKSKRESKVFRIIILTDSPSKRSEDYHRAVYELISKSKQFHTYVDILRIGNQRFYEDDIKLKIISSETQGGIFYCQTEKQFENIFLSLIKNKQEFNKIQPEEENILEKDKIFYEKMAAELLSLEPNEEKSCSLCQSELCPICTANSDETHKCYNCGAKFHGCCAAQHSLTHNIGFNHIFRCPQCGTLLKLDKEFVKAFKEEMEESYSEEEYQELYQKREESSDLSMEGSVTPTDHLEKNNSSELRNLGDGIDDPVKETEVKPEIEQNKYEHIPESHKDETAMKRESNSECLVRSEERTLKNPLTPPDIPPSSRVQGKVKLGGFLGQEVIFNSQQKRSPGTSSQENIKMKKQDTKRSITSLSPPKSKKRDKIKVCQICGATIKTVYVCPECGAKLD